MTSVLVDELLGGATSYSHSVSSAEWGDLRHLARCFAEISHERFAEVMASAAASGAPILQAHMSDGWSRDFSQTYSRGQGGASKSRRIGRRRIEWLLELVLLKTCSPSGKIEQALRYFAPRQMKSKTGWHIFASSIQCPDVLHSTSNTITMRFFLQDGLHAMGMHKKQLAWQALTLDSSAAGELGEHAASPLRAPQCWTFGMRCVIHVVHSGCKWGLASILTDDIQRSAHIAIKAVRNSSGPIYDQVLEFIRTRVMYDRESTASAGRKAFWMMLGVSHKPALAEISAVNPWWDFKNKVLHVSKDLRQDIEGDDRLAALLQYHYQWTNWTDTRWGGMPEASRRILRSQALGLDYVVKLVVDMKGTGDDTYNIGGYSRYLTGDVQKLFVTAALALRPLEVALRVLLEDDRFLLNNSDIHDRMNKSAQAVGSASDSMWESFAALVTKDEDFCGWSLRGRVLSCMHAGLAYVDKEAWAPLRALPLSLTQGDVEANLDALQAAAAPFDSQTMRILCCDQHAPGRAATLEALALLRHAPCSNQLTEKAHAPGSILSRDHARLEPFNFMTRAYVHLHASFFRDTGDERKLRNLQEEYSSLLSGSACRRQLSAKMMFLSDLVQGRQQAPAHLAGAGVKELIHQRFAMRMGIVSDS